MNLLSNFYLYFLVSKVLGMTALKRLLHLHIDSPGPIGSKSKRAGRGPRRYALHSARIQPFRQNSLQHANPQGRTSKTEQRYIYDEIHIEVIKTLHLVLNPPLCNVLVEMLARQP